jgi:hypothetical protein
MIQPIHLHHANFAFELLEAIEEMRGQQIYCVFKHHYSNIFIH